MKSAVVGIGVRIERRIGGALREHPLPPGFAHALVLRRLASPAHEEPALVDERDERERRLVLVRAARVRVVERAERLEELHVHEAVAVHADVPPLDHVVARDEEVRREVEALADGRREQVVELVHVLLAEREAVGAALHRAAVVVVEADRVVAEALETRDHHLGLLVRGEVRRAAEVHAVEAHGLAGTPLELEVAARVLHPAVLAGRRVGEAHAREVERAPGLDLLAVGERDPVRAARDDRRLDGLRHERLVGGDGERVRLRLALLPRLLPERSEAERVRLAPAPVVLNGDPLLAVGDERQHAPGRAERHGHLRPLPAHHVDAVVRGTTERALPLRRLPRPARHLRGRLRERAGEDHELRVLDGRERVGDLHLAIRQLFETRLGLDEHVRAVRERKRRDAGLLDLPAALARQPLPARQCHERAEHVLIPLAEADVARGRERHVERKRADRRQRGGD